MSSTADFSDAIPTMSSLLDPGSAEFEENRREMETAVAELRRREAQVREGGGSELVERHRSRGKLTARERIEQLIDPGTPFLELSPLAAWGMYAGEAPSAGIVTGIGRVCGREVVVVANDATVKGGTYYPMTVKKHLRAQEVAAQNRLPCIYLVDSGGAFLPLQAEVFPDRDLGEAFGGHPRLIEEDAAEMVPVRKDLGLERQERPARVDQVDAGQPVLEGNLLRPDVFLHGDRIVGPALHRRVVGDDHHLAAGYPADAGDDSRSRGLVVVQVPGRERRQLQEG